MLTEDRLGLLVWYDHFVQASQVHSAKADNEGGVPAACVI